MSWQKPLTEEEKAVASLNREYERRAERARSERLIDNQNRYLAYAFRRSSKTSTKAIKSAIESDDQTLTIPLDGRDADASDFKQYTGALLQRWAFPLQNIKGLDSRVISNNPDFQAFERKLAEKGIKVESIEVVEAQNKIGLRNPWKIATTALAVFTPITMVGGAPPEIVATTATGAIMSYLGQKASLVSSENPQDDSHRLKLKLSKADHAPAPSGQ